MSGFFDMVGELVGAVPGLPHPAAQKFLNKGWEDIRNERLWSWQIQQGPVYSAAQIVAGTVNVTQFSATVVFSAAAQAILNPLAVGATPSLLSRQFRLPGGPIYSLVTYDGAGNATLDRVYAEPSSATASYQIYRCYYTPPFVDHLRYLSILDPINGYAITGKRLYGTRDELDWRDPMRGAQGNPYYLFAYNPDSTGLMRHEFWPHPTLAQAYLATSIRRGLPLVTPSDTLPTTLPENLVIERGLFHAYKWAASHAGTDLSLKGVNWLALRADSEARYKKDLARAKKEDNEICLTNLVNWNLPSLNFLGPLDSNYAMSHDSTGFA